MTWRTLYTILKTLQPAEAILRSKMENEKDDDSIYDDVPSPSSSYFDPLDPGPTEPETEPDLYPCLTPVKAMAAVVPTAASLLQPRQAFLTPTAPPGYLSIFMAQPVNDPPLIDLFSKPPPCNPGKVTTLLDSCHEEALKPGDVSMLTALPVLCQPQLPPEYTTLQYEMIKEVRKVIKDYRLQNTYTRSLLETTGESYTVTSYDWKALLKMILTSAQYAVWSVEYRDLVIIQTMDNTTNANNMGMGMNELKGEGPYLTPQAQATLPRDALRQALLLSV